MEINGKSNQQKELRKYIIKYAQLNEKKKQWDDYFKQQQQKFYDAAIPFMKSNAAKVIEVNWRGEHGKETYVTQLIQSNTATYDIEKLQGLLNDEVAKEVIDKQYQIIDWAGFTKFMKSKGIKFKDVRDYIEINKTVNGNEMKRLTELGYIDKDKIKSAIRLTPRSEYVKIVKREE